MSFANQFFYSTYPSTTPSIYSLSLSTPLKYGCNKDSLAVILSFGLYTKNFSKRSKPAGSKLSCTDLWKGVLYHFGNAVFQSGREVTPGQTISSGVPNCLKILYN
mmetsp:Transcript_8473/g.12713  ORF Transcript_8473/g.12713 Transcript_8473/m.12713 type:complete len:105 (+) Transcript_8473:333-647(+)